MCGDSVWGGKNKGEKRRRKRPRSEDLESFQQGSSTGSRPQPRQRSLAQVCGYKPLVKKVTYPLCKHKQGRFLVDSDVCFNYGQSGHKHKDVPSAKKDCRKGRVPIPPLAVLTNSDLRFNLAVE
ncbi:hypothetical protein HAX54_024462 [Datura stramonium]|uniref:Uncharacterized protein n=1 Tax=Datura stramonium TaxID=4076 RepID=A0ABS8UZR6_DATST|nr:hypothetical protein [Datura stramonium]